MPDERFLHGKGTRVSENRRCAGIDATAELQIDVQRVRVYYGAQNPQKDLRVSGGIGDSKKPIFLKNLGSSIPNPDLHVILICITEFGAESF